MNYMAATQQRKTTSNSRLTFITLALMIVVGGIIIYLDRAQVRQLEGKAEWNYLLLALGCIALAYACESYSMVVIFRLFGIHVDQGTLLRVGLVSAVLSNFIALPASLALRVLVLGRHGVSNNQTVSASLLLAYFKNLVFYALIPAGLIYAIFTYPTVFGGVIVMSVFAALLSVVIVAVTILILSSRYRSLFLRLAGRAWHFITRRHIEQQLSDFGEAITQGISAIRQRRKTALLLLGLIIADVAWMITGLYFCFRALVIPVHLGVLLTGFNFGVTLTVISFIPGDMGVQEASIAGIMALFGVPFGQSVLAAILFRVLYYFVPFVFSLGFYLSLVNGDHSKAA
jgi:glycosyltransferase 2 family protein